MFWIVCSRTEEVSLAQGTCSSQKDTGEAQDGKGSGWGSVWGDLGRAYVQGSDGGVMFGKAQLRVESKG